MEVQDLERMIREKENVISLAFPALMRKVYVWMSLALVITGVTAYGVANSPSLMTAIYSSRMTFWILIIAQLALVIGVTRAIDRLSLTSATLLFILYSVLNGAMLSAIFAVYSTTVITQVFFITAGTD